MQELYTTPEVARMLHISRIAVFKKIKSGKIKAVKSGRNFVIRKEDLLEALGTSLGDEKKRAIDKVIGKALKEYGEAFKMLGRE